MRILILTQDENLFLPQSVASVCRARHKDVVCVVAAPAMSTHGGAVRGFRRHFRLFGVRGTARMVARVLWRKLKARFTRSGQGGPFYSLAQVARAWSVPYHRVAQVNGEEFAALLEGYQPDLLVSLSCPQIVGKAIRQRFPLGCINVHGAPLPRYRGLMPAFWMLCRGERMAAVSVHDLGDRLDDGLILVQKHVPIAETDTWFSLVAKTKAAGAEALLDAIDQIERGTVKRQPNPREDATYCSFPTAEDGQAFRAAGRQFL